ncbi:hypothetical protein AADC60_08115 [Cytobacillus pseudoceanisediminis]|uniref:DUF695 domain-containing protein n=2 Tax=Cytobacillus TaxID=2675230 RepID=A0ABX3CU57_9BACI|nr:MULTISPECIES: hypothetical protein [Cytobacillus]EFV79032.1 hypothetical protein HMPREF1013_00660 [Bacillus sp. 2_A_57_CT2]MBY0156948.1 hypothetical protein [Cytobacillus firmus]MCM3391978.1 hypothetical protein [Cytobacillus oceanisediminis]MCM3528389.1 hypothetical protein [Cytobacillus oceanisediminis]OHX49017.1 hypothetical protein BBV17_14460 [Cytobacillus oceanisediminis]
MFKKLFGKNFTAAEFWIWFEKNSQDYYQLKEEKLNSLFYKLDKQLSKINEDIAFEFSADLIDGKREFIISADGILSAFTDVIDLVEKAPKLDGFKIIAFRPKSDVDDISTIEYEDISLGPDDVFFTYRKNGDTLDIVLYLKGYDSDFEEWENAAFILLDTIIGEYDVATKIGSIDMLPYKGSPKLKPILELPSLIDREVSGISF